MMLCQEGSAEEGRVMLVLRTPSEHPPPTALFFFGVPMDVLRPRVSKFSLDFCLRFRLMVAH
jgi:hypothetical protein